jgi:ribonuclease-3
MFDRFRALFKTSEEGVNSERSPVSLPEKSERILSIENLLGVTVVNPSYFYKALRHRSRLVDEDMIASDSYEQLEFLGDAVLDLIISEMLFELYPNENEGFMTKARSRLVKGTTLAKISKKLKLNEYLEIGDRAKQQGIDSSKSVLADVFEALVGAIYKDTGYEAARTFVNQVYATKIDIKEIAHKLDNYKSALLEFTQGKKLGTPLYRVIDESGPPHERIFTVEVLVEQDVMGIGSGTNKKRAEQKAAFEALNSYNALD